MHIGQKVTIHAPADSSLARYAKWWPKGVLTGTVQKLFKNGKVAVGVDQLPNNSDDGRKTMNFPADWLREAYEPTQAEIDAYIARLAAADLAAGIE